MAETNGSADLSGGSQQGNGAEPSAPPGFDDEPVRQMYDLVLDLDGFEGPIDLLLTLARQQKVDLTRISILTLAEQYLSFISAAKRLRLEVAADYLVMAAWLAYLKSRLLLPVAEEDAEDTGPELAEALTFQLRRLDSMRSAGERLLALPRLGRDIFPRGAPEGMEVVKTSVYEISLYELLKAYGDNRRRTTGSSLTIEASKLMSLSEALERMSGVIGTVRDWTQLGTFLPRELMDGLVYRSTVAATFAASLELVREGRAQIRQSTAFGTIFIKGKEAAPAAGEDV